MGKGNRVKKVLSIFSSMYDRVLGWSEHPKAPYYLAFLSFSEASFFPIPPDFMLAPMSISKPQRAWWYATVTTLSSVLGGIFGYLLGLFFISLIEPYLVKLGYEVVFHKVQHWFLTWGFWALFFVGFTPIPYKVFTIASGAVGMPMLPFILASMVGRGSRFYLVSALMRMGGKKMKNHLRVYIDWMGWILLAIIISLLALYFFR
ncbi:MAG: DedA family protein [Gammaproteobacteria bacterium]|nr:DedA family protein [Gammaproteobacteria bacterium]